MIANDTHIPIRNHTHVHIETRDHRNLNTRMREITSGRDEIHTVQGGMTFMMTDEIDIATGHNHPDVMDRDVLETKRPVFVTGIGMMIYHLSITEISNHTLLIPAMSNHTLPAHPPWTWQIVQPHPALPKRMGTHWMDSAQLA